VPEQSARPIHLSSPTRALTVFSRWADGCQLLASRDAWNAVLPASPSSTPTKRSTLVSTLFGARWGPERWWRRVHQVEEDARHGRRQLREEAVICRQLNVAPGWVIARARRRLPEHAHA